MILYHRISAYVDCKGKQLHTPSHPHILLRVQKLCLMCFGTFCLWKTDRSKGSYSKAEIFVSFNPWTTSRELSCKFSMKIFNLFLNSKTSHFCGISSVWLNHTSNSPLAVALLLGKSSVLWNWPWLAEPTLYSSLNYCGLKLTHPSEGLPSPSAASWCHL